MNCMLVLIFFSFLPFIVNGRRPSHPNPKKEFIKLVEDLNLNLSIIGTYLEDLDENGQSDVVSVKWQMPLNTETATNPTLDITTPKRYFLVKENLPNAFFKYSEIVIENGREETVNEVIINPQNIIPLPKYDHLVQNVDGKIKYKISSNGSYTTAFNYVLSNPTNDGEKNIHIIDSSVSINEVVISKDFPAEVLEEIKKLLPKLIFSIDDFTLLAKMLGMKLDKTFDPNSFEVLINVDNVAFGTKPFAELQFGPANLLVIIR